MGSSREKKAEFFRKAREQRYALRKPLPDDEILRRYPQAIPGTFQDRKDRFGQRSDRTVLMHCSEEGCGNARRVRVSCLGVARLCNEHLKRKMHADMIARVHKFRRLDKERRALSRRLKHLEE